MASSNNTNDRQLISRKLALVVSPSILAISLFVNYLRFNNYPLLTSETVICFVVIGLFSIILGAAISHIRSSEIQVLLSSLLFIVFIETAVSLETKRILLSHIENYEPKILLLLIFIFLIFLILLLLLSLRNHFPSIILVSYTVFLAGTLVLPVYSMPYGLHSSGNDDDGENINAEPSTLHLLLDGHMGIDAIPTNIKGGSDLKRRLVEFYTSWGFAVHTNAFSQHVLTQDTVSTLFNGETGIPSEELLGAGIGTRHRFTLRQNKYFESQLEKQFSVHVVQSDYLDYCSFDSDIYCFTYPSVSLRGLKDVSLPGHLKARRLIRTYFNHSALALFFEKFISRDGQDPRIPIKYYSLATHTAIDITKQLLLENPSNALIYAHVLMPHAPYVWASNCDIRTEDEVWFRPLINSSVSRPIPSIKRETDYIDYFNQTHCMITLLDEIFTELSDRGQYDNLNIVIHGDHGSRLDMTPTRIENINTVNTRDVLDSYSTLFAVRNSHSQPSVVTEQYSLIELFSKYNIFSITEIPDPVFWFRSKDSIGNEIIEWKSVPFTNF